MSARDPVAGGDLLANREAREMWSKLAPVWSRFDAHFDQIAGEPGRLAIQRLGAGPGHRVLDVGCGTGGTTLELARLVSPGGRVVGVDITEEMAEAARRRHPDDDAVEVSFLVADAQVSDFGGGRFDRAFSRFGVMFFSDPVAAFANIRRALVAGGRLSFVCWQPPLRNEWMAVPAQAAMAALGVEAPPPAEGPGPFSLGDPERVTAVLEEAGYGTVDVRAHEDSVVIDAAGIDEVAEVSTRVGLVAELLREAGEEDRRRVRAAISGALRERLDGGVVTASRAVLLVTAEA